MDESNKKIDAHVVQKMLISLGVIVLVLGISLLLPSSRDSQNRTDDVSVEITNPFELLSLEAKAFLVWDVANEEILFSKNEDAQLPLASLAKLMTAVVAVELLDKDAVVTIGADAIANEGDSGLLVNEKWALRDLIDFTLVMSSNDGAAALADAIDDIFSEDALEGTTFFDYKVREKIEELGMTQTFFINESGLDVSIGTSGAYGSAYDIAKLFSYTISRHPKLVEGTTFPALSFSSLNEVEHIAINTNKDIQSLPGVIASKTGYTDIAGGNLAVAFEAGPAHPIVVVVLGSGLEERFMDVKDLVWATLDYLKLDNE